MRVEIEKRETERLHTAIDAMKTAIENKGRFKKLKLFIFNNYLKQKKCFKKWLKINFFFYNFLR